MRACRDAPMGGGGIRGLTHQQPHTVSVDPRLDRKEKSYVPTLLKQEDFKVKEGQNVNDWSRFTSRQQQISSVGRYRYLLSPTSEITTSHHDNMYLASLSTAGGMVAVNMTVWRNLFFVLKFMARAVVSSAI